jgi:hypothetical protein
MALVSKILFLFIFLVLLFFAGFSSFNLKGCIPEFDRFLLISIFGVGSYFFSLRVAEFVDRNVGNPKSK